jgi:UrcA family protein
MKNEILIALAGAAVLSMFSVGDGYANDHQLRYAPAELSTDAGVINVYDRIHGVAKNVCGEQYGGPKLVKYRASRERCIDNVVEYLVEEVGDARLSEIHFAAGQA